MWSPHSLMALGLALAISLVLLGLFDRLNVREGKALDRGLKFFGVVEVRR